MCQNFCLLPLGEDETSRSGWGNLRMLIRSFSLVILRVSPVAPGSFADLSHTAAEGEYFSQGVKQGICWAVLDPSAAYKDSCGVSVSFLSPSLCS